MPSAMNARLEGMFEQAGCRGQLCVQSLDGAQEIAVDADKQVVAASVFKVLVALEAETQFAECRLDPRERVDLHVASRTPGPTGFSLFRDDVDVSLRDLVVAMLTISDNEATDALLRRVGIETLNASAKRLGLACTVITGDLRTTELDRPRRGLRRLAGHGGLGGSLVGVIRNEIGVISYPHGRCYVAAVFTQAHQPGQNGAAIDSVIGATAATAVSILSGQST